ncbi:phage tail tape measure protein [Vannielia sp.]|uniref:phage tail tape measure protein n=1 Tax=Vannielia sp. TaxID=2813045 RepID=UPI0026161CBE|nr:phage tail tape measure protein [Vannielia sp.]MDF1873003.1 phage tail tape measure protein [Vannielia sp.]
MADFDGADALEAQVDALENALGGATQMTAAFDAELQRMQTSLTVTQANVGQLSNQIGRGLRNAFDGLAFDGMRLSDALKTVAQSMIDATYNATIKPITNHFGGLIGQGVESFITGAQAFEKGGTFSQGRVQPFARGGVVTQPTYFGMRGGTGLMGEAGPEAIMPLARGADGSLGVKTRGGGGAVNVVMNITTPDAGSFQRSRSQIAAQMNRALAQGQRNR